MDIRKSVIWSKIKVKCDITIDIKDGKKKVLNFPKWKNVKEDLTTIGAKNYLIRTGEINNITVIDLDNKGINGVENFEKNIAPVKDLNTLITKSPNNGYHLYFKYNKSLKTTTKTSLGIDIRNDDALMYEGEGYALFKDVNELLEVPEKFIEYYNNDEDEIAKIEKELNDKGEPLDVVVVDVNDEIMEHGYNIDLDYWTNYSDWIKIVWSLKSNNVAYEKVKILSKRAINFNEKELNKIWESFNDNQISGGTFYYYSKKSNYKNYIEIKRKYNRDFIKQSILSNTTEDFTICFYKLFGEDFIHKNKDIYFFNGIFWENKKLAIRQRFVKDFTDIIYDFIQKEMKRNIEKYLDDTKKLNDENAKLLRVLKCLKTNSFIEACCSSLTSYIDNPYINFEINPYIFCFNNKVYDLEKSEFVKTPNRDDYMIITTGYDWREPTDDEVKEIEKMIDKILPIKEEKEFYMTILSTGLFGKTLENFTIANAPGRNGKGFINELVGSALGNYSYVASNTVLMNNLKDGANPTIANMNHKRIIFYREPDAKNRLNASTIKELTGGNEINARANFSNDTKTYLKGTHILECNEKPMMSGNIDKAITARLYDIYFRATFTKDKDEVDELNWIYLGDDAVKQPEYREKHKFAMIRILFKYWDNYKKNKYNLIVPESVKQNVEDYLTDSDTLLSWFKNLFEKTDDTNDIIKLKDLHEKWLEDNTTPKDKNNIYKNFYNGLTTITYIKKYYKERFQKGEKQYKNILWGWKAKQEEKD